MPNQHDSSGMTYRDNIVRVYVGDASAQGYRLVRGAFNVAACSVTPGQDPRQENHAGLVKYFGADGNLSFRVGRKGSEAVAKWMNEHIPAHGTTFNQPASSLNFAHFGHLTIVLSGGRFAKAHTLVLPEIMLAQGREGTSNTWWLGGKGCRYIDKHRVLCSGFDHTANRAPVSLILQRGDNRENVIEVVDVFDVDLANWMGGLASSTRLREVTMPGSHDAGMSETHHCTLPVGVPEFSKTQALSIAQQLAAGVRYLDIRVDYDHGELVTYHRQGAWGCNGEPLRNLFSALFEFLPAHSGETVIAKFSHIRNHALETKQAIRAEIDAWRATHAKHIYTSASQSVDLEALPLGELAGKAVFVFDYDEYVDPQAGLFRYSGGTSVGANLRVYDAYSNTRHYAQMEADQLEKWQAVGPRHSPLFLLSWTLTPVSELFARRANDQLEQVLERHAPHHGEPNIVFMDYLTPAYCAVVARRNIR